MQFRCYQHNREYFKRRARESDGSIITLQNGATHRNSREIAWKTGSLTHTSTPLWLRILCPERAYVVFVYSIKPTHSHSSNLALPRSIDFSPTLIIRGNRRRVFHGALCSYLCDVFVLIYRFSRPPSTLSGSGQEDWNIVLCVVGKACLLCTVWLLNRLKSAAIRGHRVRVSVCSIDWEAPGFLFPGVHWKAPMLYIGDVFCLKFCSTSPCYVETVDDVFATHPPVYPYLPCQWGLVVRWWCFADT